MFLVSLLALLLWLYFPAILLGDPFRRSFLAIFSGFLFGISCLAILSGYPCWRSLLAILDGYPFWLYFLWDPFWSSFLAILSGYTFWRSFLAMFFGFLSSYGFWLSFLGICPTGSPAQENRRVAARSSPLHRRVMGRENCSWVCQHRVVRACRTTGARPPPVR